MRALLISICVASVLGCAASSAIAATPAVSVGLDYACALTEAGGVTCWGSNYNGQLGTGTQADSAIPAAVPGVSGAVQLGAGDDQACVLITDGTVKCWGSNDFGAIGSGTPQPGVATPTTIAGISGVSKISVGRRSVCAIVGGPPGGLKCWGFGGAGALGIGSTPAVVTTPGDVSGLTSGVTDVSVGDDLACAVVSAAIKCWGENVSKAIDGTAATAYPSPQNVAGTTGAATVSVGRGHVCMTTTTGATKCWGYNTSGQSGNGATAVTNTTPQSTLIDPGASISGHGDSHVCALLAGSARCWGSNVHGQIGSPVGLFTSTPVTPAGLGSGVTSIDAGGYNSCAIVSNVVKCWGEIGSGALGDGRTNNHNTPVTVPGVNTATGVDVATDHACSTASAGITCWGDGSLAQLGTGNTNSSLSPVAATAFTGPPTHVATSRGTTCGVFTNAVKCVGSGGSGQLGDGSTSYYSLTSVNASSPLSSGTGMITGNELTNCALNASKAYCWGTNLYSKLGQGAGQTFSVLDHLTVPTEVVGLGTGVTGIAVGFFHSCAAVSGTLKCWGMDFNGETTASATHGEQPVVQTPGLTGVATHQRAVAVAGTVSCAIVTSPSGAVKCFGGGGLGDGSGRTGGSLTPVTVTGITGATALAGAADSICALVSGAVKCWGYNWHGQLGNSNNAYASTPVTVSGISNATHISGQGASYCARLSTGAVKCWGLGDNGQLGVASELFAQTPVDVVGVSVVTPTPPASYVKQKIKATLKLNGKIKKSGKKLISVPLKLYFKIPAGANPATVCTGKTTVSIKTSKKKTTKLKVKFKRKSPNCSFTGKIKLPKSFKGKKKKFTVAVPTNSDVLSYKSTKTLKLK